jgi:hypothetical protein
MPNNNNYSEQIDKLSEELEQLRLDFNRKSDRIKKSIERLESKLQDDNTFEIGNHVEITNTYKGLKGTRGFIIKITDKQVVLREESSKRNHTRSKKNIKKVDV